MVTLPPSACAELALTVPLWFTVPAVKNTFPPEVVIESELMVPVLLITDAFRFDAALAAIII